MEYRPLDITVISSDDLKDVNLMSKMDVFVIVSVAGDPRTQRKTPVDKDGGKSPKWNHRLNFSVDEAAISSKSSNLCIVFKIMSERTLGDKEIGAVSVPVKELFDNANADGEDRVVEYQVRTSSGKSKGSLKFSYKFGNKVAAPMAPSTSKAKGSGEPVTAYPPPPGVGYPPPGVGYAPQPYGHPTGYPPQPGYGYPPQAPGYPGGYPPAQHGYGYPPPPQGYGGGYAPPPQMVQQPKKKKKGNFGLGLGAGLLGGLLVGDMISDVGDMNAYDAGYDDAMSGGFDF